MSNCPVRASNVDLASTLHPSPPAYSNRAELSFLSAPCPCPAVRCSLLRALRSRPPHLHRVHALRVQPGSAHGQLQSGVRGHAGGAAPVLQCRAVPKGKKGADGWWCASPLACLAARGPAFLQAAVPAHEPGSATTWLCYHDVFWSSNVPGSSLPLPHSWSLLLLATSHLPCSVPCQTAATASSLARASCADPDSRKSTGAACR